jgi:hypothetical protein
MFQFLKCHIIKAGCFLRRSGRRRHFGVVFQVGGESERAFFVFFTSPPKGRPSLLPSCRLTALNLYKTLAANFTARWRPQEI